MANCARCGAHIDTMLDPCVVLYCGKCLPAWRESYMSVLGLTAQQAAARQGATFPGDYADLVLREQPDGTLTAKIVGHAKVEPAKAEKPGREA